MSAVIVDGAVTVVVVHIIFSFRFRLKGGLARKWSGRTDDGSECRARDFIPAAKRHESGPKGCYRFHSFLACGACYQVRCPVLGSSTKSARPKSTYFVVCCSHTVAMSCNAFFRVRRYFFSHNATVSNKREPISCGVHTRVSGSTPLPE